MFAVERLVCFLAVNADMLSHVESNQDHTFVSVQANQSNLILWMQRHLKMGPMLSLAKQRRRCYTPRMDEGRKRTLLIAASILVARKLANWDGRPSPSLECAIADSITLAEKIMQRIDARWPTSQTA